MTRDEFSRIFRVGEWPSWFRLARPLEAIIIDFDYAKTRKLLEPTWDGYTMPKGHDIIERDVDLHTANLLTSAHKDGSGLHRCVLDIDYGARVSPILTYGSDCKH